MAKYEYTGDGTVSIDIVGQVSPGDIVEAPTALNLGKRGDFKSATGATDADVALVVEVPVEQPDQTPESEKQYEYVPSEPDAAPDAAPETIPAPVPAPVSTTTTTTAPEGK